MEKIRFSLGVPNRNPNNSRRAITLEDAIQKIKDKKYGKKMEADLIAILNTHPVGAYEGFFKNIMTYIKRINDKKDV